MSSILAVTQAATVTALTTRNAFKLANGITDASKDALIDARIAGASADINSFCNRVFARQSYSETFRQICRAEVLLLNRYPVATIASVTADGTVLDPAEYEVDAETGLLYALSNDARICWTASKLVVAYSAGYLLPGQADRDLPHDIEEACLEQVKSVWFASGRDPLVKSEKVDGVGETEYWVGQTGDNAALAPQVCDRIERYRDIRL